VIRRTVLAFGALAAVASLSSCSTFSRSDAVASVDDQEMSRDQLDQFTEGNSTGDAARLAISRWLQVAAVGADLGDITSLEELAFVSGMDEVEKVQPFWRDHFTIRSDALIDFNAASQPLIQALTGATADAAANFIAVRNGDDGIEGTVDDYTFDDSGEVQSLLGISDGEWSEFSEFVTLEGTIRRIESIGKVGDFTETRVVLAEETTEDGKSILKPLARFRE
jgi:hypothetical protein